MTEGEESSLGACARIVRRMDPDRFLTAVTAPPDRRPALFALYAFNAEVAKTREAVSEAMLGEIRLQWWRDAIAECFDGNPRRHEVTEPLAEAVAESNPDRRLFDELIDARARDLDDAPPPDMSRFEEYAFATSGGLIRLAAQFLGARETEDTVAAANDIGLAYALVGSARALPFQIQRKHTMLPKSVFDEAGADDSILYAGKPHEAINRAVASILDEAGRRLKSARKRRRKVSSASTPAFVAGRIAQANLKQLRRVGCDPYDSRLSAPPGLRALSIAWGARTGRW